MKEPTTDSAVAYAIALLSHYGFELRGYTAEELVNLWLENYSAHWIRLAVIEALYQGRYKAISVEQILAVWARRGQPRYRFNHEFERLISRKLPQNLTAPLHTAIIEVSEVNTLPPPMAKDDTSSDNQTQVEEKPEVPTTQPEIPLPEETDLEDVTETPVEVEQPPLEAYSQADNPLNYDADWSRCEVKRQPIHQFTPPPDDSGFFLKLKEVAHKQVEIPPKLGTPMIEEANSEPPQSNIEKN